MAERVLQVGQLDGVDVHAQGRVRRHGDHQVVQRVGRAEDRARAGVGVPLGGEAAGRGRAARVGVELLEELDLEDVMMTSGMPTQLALPGDIIARAEDEGEGVSASAGERERG